MVKQGILHAVLSVNPETDSVPHEGFTRFLRITFNSTVSLGSIKTIPLNKNLSPEC